MANQHPRSADTSPRQSPLPIKPADPDELYPSSLHILAETLSLMERDVQDSLALIRQLLVHLQQQTEALSNSRQTLENLLQAGPFSPVPAPARAAPARMRIHGFGPFEVCRDDEVIPLRIGKASAILKFLVLRLPQPVQRDVLLEAIWPQTDPSIAKNRLKVAMHHLRQAFVSDGCSPNCEGCVVFQDGVYLFNPAISVWTDIQAFEQAWQSGVRLERAGRLIEAIPYYLQAESLYRGDLLEEDLYEEWTLIRREELKDSYLTILDKLSRYWLRIGALDEAIEGWKKILARDPWREDIYRRVMACNARRGQRGLALRWYEMCTQALSSQLNVEPEPETVALQRRILAGEDVSEWISV